MTLNTNTSKINTQASSRLPDLLNIEMASSAPALASLAGSLESFMTKPFQLHPPPYTDRDIPLPEPYNSAYPHPLTSYASPGVNPATVSASGYQKALIQLLEHDPSKAKGSILASSEHVNALPPALAFNTIEGEGNGIPEKFWSTFESSGAAHLPVGMAGVSPFAKQTRASTAMPPRFLQSDNYSDASFGSPPEVSEHYLPQQASPVNKGGYLPTRESELGTPVHLMPHALSGSDVRYNAFHTLNVRDDAGNSSLSCSDDTDLVCGHHAVETPSSKIGLRQDWREGEIYKYGGSDQVSGALDRLFLIFDYSMFMHEASFIRPMYP